MARKARGTNVTIYLPAEILREADRRADREGTSRSAVIALALSLKFGLGFAPASERRGTP